MNEQYVREINGYKIKDEEAIRTYENVSSMKSDTKLTEGMYVKTKGYYNVNDGGNGEYIIRAKNNNDVEDNGFIHFIQNNLVAELIINNEVNVEQFGAKGDGTTDDTNAIINALLYSNNIKGNLNNQYYVTSNITINNKNIKDLNILAEPFDVIIGNTYFDVFTCSGLNNFTNVKVESKFDYIPSIEKHVNPQTQTTGRASNVHAFNVISGITNFYRCKTNYCWAFNIIQTGKVNIYDFISSNNEMSFYIDSTNEVNVYNSKFNINKQVDSIYYHHIYAKEGTNIKFYNCVFDEIGEGTIGNHYHCYSTTFNPNTDSIGLLRLENCTLKTLAVAGQINCCNLDVNGGYIEAKNLLADGNNSDKPLALFKNVTMKFTNNANAVLFNSKSIIEECNINIDNDNLTTLSKYAYKLINSTINNLLGTLNFAVNSASSENVITEEVVINNNFINSNTISWCYPYNCEKVRISNNIYNLITRKTAFNPMDRGSIGFIYNCIFNNWNTPLNENSSNNLKYNIIADNEILSNIQV